MLEQLVDGLALYVLFPILALWVRASILDIINEYVRRQAHRRKPWIQA